MAMVPVMWLVWGTLVLLFVLLKIYAGRLSRDESDQLVLDEAFEHLKSENAAVLAKVGRVESVSRVVMWMLAATTAIVIVYYVFDVVHQLQ